MDLRRYRKRHDEVLDVLGNSIRIHLPPNFSITIDSPSNPYSFPHHITPTNLRPDIVWWSEQLSELCLFELTISYEAIVADAKERKRSKYHDLMEAGRAAGFRCELITLEVGSRGMLNLADLEPLQEALGIPRKDLVMLALTIIRTTILELFGCGAAGTASPHFPSPTLSVYFLYCLYYQYIYVSDTCVTGPGSPG